MSEITILIKGSETNQNPASKLVDFSESNINPNFVVYTTEEIRKLAQDPDKIYIQFLKNETININLLDYIQQFEEFNNITVNSDYDNYNLINNMLSLSGSYRNKIYNIIVLLNSSKLRRDATLDIEVTEPKLNINGKETAFFKFDMEIFENDEEENNFRRNFINEVSLSTEINKQQLTIDNIEFDIETSENNTDKSIVIIKYTVRNNNTYPIPTPRKVINNIKSQLKNQNSPIYKGFISKYLQDNSEDIIVPEETNDSFIRDNIELTTNNVYEYNLFNLFNIDNLNYTITSNIHNNALITNDILNITGNFRNETYNILIDIENDNFTKQTLNLTVKEPNKVYLPAVFDLELDIKLNEITEKDIILLKQNIADSLNIDIQFIDINFDDIKANPFNFTLNDIDSTVILPITIKSDPNNDYVPLNKIVDLQQQSIDPDSKFNEGEITSKSSININEELQNKINNPNTVFIILNDSDTKYYDLYDYFQGNNLTFQLEDNYNFTSIDNSNLVLEGKFRNTTYDILVKSNDNQEIKFNITETQLKIYNPIENCEIKLNIDYSDIGAVGTDTYLNFESNFIGNIIRTLKIDKNSISINNIYEDDNGKIVIDYNINPDQNSEFSPAQILDRLNTQITDSNSKLNQNVKKTGFPNLFTNSEIIINEKIQNQIKNPNTIYIKLENDIPYLVNLNDFIKINSTAEIYKDPYNSATIQNNIVSINGNFRNTSYIVSIRIPLSSSKNKIININVEEPAPIIIPIVKKYPKFTLANNDIEINLIDYYNGSNLTDLDFTIISNPYSNLDIIDNVLNIKGDYRNIDYTVKIAPTDYLSSILDIEIKELEPLPIKLINDYSDIKLTKYDPLVYDLSDVFSGNNLTYEIVNPKDNVTLNDGIITINHNNTSNIDIDYKIEVIAKNKSAKLKWNISIIEDKSGSLLNKNNNQFYYLDNNITTINDIFDDINANVTHNNNYINFTNNNFIITDIDNFFNNKSLVKKNFNGSNENGNKDFEFSFIKKGYNRTILELEEPTEHIYVENEYVNINLADYKLNAQYTLIYNPFEIQDNIKIEDDILKIKVNSNGIYDILVNIDNELYVFRIYEPLINISNYTIEII